MPVAPEVVHRRAGSRPVSRARRSAASTQPSRRRATDRSRQAHAGPGHRKHKRVTVVVAFPGRQWSRAKETLEQLRSSGWWSSLHYRPILTNTISGTPASGKGACMGVPGVRRGVAAPSISRHSVQCVASRVLHQLTSEKCMFWKIARLIGWLVGFRTTDILDILRPRFSPRFAPPTFVR